MLRRSLVTVAATAVVVTATGLPAVAVNNYPDEPSEAAASVLDSTLFQEALAAAAYSDAGSVSNAGPNEGNLNVELLGSELISLGDVEVPLDDILDFGQAGALVSRSEASSPKDAYAVSGLAGADGGVTLDGETEDFGKASVDVLSVARLLGVDGLTDEIVDQLLLEAGAGAAEVKAEDGVILDQDGVGGLGQYRVADLDLFLHSPVIEDAASSIYDIGGTIDTTVEDLVNENLDDSALTGLFDAVPGVPTPSITVDSNMQENLFQSVVGEPITSANQLITIDLSTGELQVHLDKLVDGPNEGGINALDPNTELINDETYPLIAETVHELMEEVTNILIGAIEDSLNSVTINVAFYEEGPLGTLDVSWALPLADAVNGNFPEAVNNSTGTMAPVAELLVGTINTVGPALAPILEPVYDLLISDEGDKIFELLINDLKTDAITAPIRELLSPVFEVLAKVLSITINRQVSETADAVAPATTEAAPAVTSFDLNALSIALLPDAEVARINLGNAAVRIQGDGGSEEPGEIDPSISVDPSVVAPGDSTEATGTGYTPDSTATVQLTDPAGEPVGEPIAVDTDADGGFTVDVPVPADAEPGSFTVVGTDDTTGEAAEAPLTVQVGGGSGECTDPSITADPTSVMAGEDVQVTGTGFPRNENVIVQLLDLDGNKIGDPVTVLVDEDCGFTTPITVPEGTPPGVIIVDAQPEDGGEGAQTPIAVVGGNDGGDRELTAWFEKEQVVAGESQTFYASGFDEGEQVVAFIHSTPFGLPAETADADGNVEWTFDVPADFEVGTHVGVATSLDHGDQASAEFSVVSSSVGDGSGNGDGDAGAGAGNGDGGLAATGANVTALIAAMVLLLGAGAVMIKRRREISQAFATAMGRMTDDKPAV